MTLNIGNASVRDLITYSLHWHLRKFKTSPKMLLLHPVMFNQLRTDKLAIYEFGISSNGEFFFRGIPVAVSLIYDWGGIVAANGDVELI